MNNSLSRTLPLIVSLVLTAGSQACPAQTFLATPETESAPTDRLPEAPSATLQAAPPAGALAGTGQVAGVVLDPQGDPVPGAQVILSAPGILGQRLATAGTDGSFSFIGVPAGSFRIITTAQGMSTYTSAEFLVHPGESVTIPKFSLPIASENTTVNVFASSDQIAQAQVQEQEKQRVFGVFPNFYTSYIWNAKAMPARQKYKLALRTLVDPVTFVVIAGVAGAEQYHGTYPGYGPGIQGFGSRYAAAYGDALTSRIIGSAVLPALFHQDPRYFYQGSGGVRWRAIHAVGSTVVTRGDNGKRQPNYSHILGSLAAGAIANSYHPDSSKGLGLTFETLGIVTAANAAGNLIREFVLRGLVPSVPSFATGK